MVSTKLLVCTYTIIYILSLYAREAFGTFVSLYYIHAKQTNKPMSSLILTEAEIATLGGSVEKLASDLSLPNPAYVKAKRFGSGKYHHRVPQYICHLQKDGDKFVVPRYYFGEQPCDCIEGRDLTSEHRIVLRDYQKEFFSTHAKDINNSTGVLLEAPCGHGKTTMGVWLAYQRGKQTLILVPTYYLARQWEARLLETTTATVSVLSSSDKEVPTESDFTIVCLDLFNVRALPRELVNNIGHVILDEAHRLGAETYTPILNEVPAKYRTSLTATFRREDGMHKILAYHFGVHLKLTNQFPRPSVFAVKTEVRVKCIVSKNKPWENFAEFLSALGVKAKHTKSSIVFSLKSAEIFDLQETAREHHLKGKITTEARKEIIKCLMNCEKLSFPVIESYLNEDAKRRKVVISLIKKSLEAGRTVLFLSKRKDTLRALHKYFEEYQPALIISETNRRSEEEEEFLQKKCRLILGVTQLAKEGLDIDRLDTLIIHLPLKDTEQAIGRIARLHPTKKQPIAFYLVDDCPLTYATYNNAKKFFKINAEFKGEIRLSEVDRFV